MLIFTKYPGSSRYMEANIYIRFKHKRVKLNISYNLVKNIKIFDLTFRLTGRNNNWQLKTQSLELLLQTLKHPKYTVCNSRRLCSIWSKNTNVTRDIRYECTCSGVLYPKTACVLDDILNFFILQILLHNK